MTAAQVGVYPAELAHDQTGIINFQLPNRFYSWESLQWWVLKGRWCDCFKPTNRIKTSHEEPEKPASLGKCECLLFSVLKLNWKLQNDQKSVPPAFISESSVQERSMGWRLVWRAIIIRLVLNIIWAKNWSLEWSPCILDISGDLAFSFKRVNTFLLQPLM